MQLWLPPSETHLQEAFFVEHIELDLHVQIQVNGIYSARGVAFQNTELLGLHYSTTIWLIGLIFLWKHLDIISSSQQFEPLQLKSNNKPAQT